MSTKKHVVDEFNPFTSRKGYALENRLGEFANWASERKKTDIWPYNRSINGPVGTSVSFIKDDSVLVEMSNIASQDYLGIAAMPEIKEAAIEGIHQYGVHSAGSGALAGFSTLTREVESKLEAITGFGSALLFSSGWGACFGAVTGLVEPHDYLIIDAYSHNCLSMAAKSATKNKHTFRHNDLIHLESKLNQIRTNDLENAVFIVTESLFSMHADGPEIESLLNLSKEYNAILILDVAHDFGARGKHGLGAIEEIPAHYRENVIVCGAFSKTFASTGGFILGPADLKVHMHCFCPTFVFTNAISPMHCAVINKAIDIAFSDEGHKRRKQLAENAKTAHAAFKAQGFTVIGKESAVMPLLIGDTQVARLMAKRLYDQNILANLIEYPAVPLDQSMFRVQLSASFSQHFIRDLAYRFAEAMEFALQKIHINHRTQTISNETITSDSVVF